MTARDASGRDLGPKFLFVEVGATQNRNTGPPRHTLGKGGKPILTTAAVLPKYRRIPNPRRASKYGSDGFCAGEQECARRCWQRGVKLQMARLYSNV